MTNELTMLQKNMLVKIEMMLQNMGCTYLIKTPDGEVHSTLPKEFEKKKRVITVKHGAIKQHVTPYVEQLQPGQSVYIPVNNFPIYSVQSSAGQVAKGLWGERSWMTTLHRDKDAVELLRHDDMFK